MPTECGEGSSPLVCRILLVFITSLSLVECARIEEISNGFVIGLGGTLRCSGCDYSICASSCLLSASIEEPPDVPIASPPSSSFGVAATAADTTCAGFDYDTKLSECYFHTMKTICLPLTTRSSGINTRLVTCNNAVRPSISSSSLATALANDTGLKRSNEQKSSTLVSNMTSSSLKDVSSNENHLFDMLKRLPSASLAKLRPETAAEQNTVASPLPATEPVSVKPIQWRADAAAGAPLAPQVPAANQIFSVWSPYGNNNDALYYKMPIGHPLSDFSGHKSSMFLPSSRTINSDGKTGQPLPIISTVSIFDSGLADRASTTSASTFTTSSAFLTTTQTTTTSPIIPATATASSTTAAEAEAAAVTATTTTTTIMPVPTLPTPTTTSTTTLNSATASVTTASQTTPPTYTTTLSADATTATTTPITVPVSATTNPSTNSTTFTMESTISASSPSTSTTIIPTSTTSTTPAITAIGLLQADQSLPLSSSLSRAVRRSNSSSTSSTQQLDNNFTTPPVAFWATVTLDSSSSSSSSINNIKENNGESNSTETMIATQTTGTTETTTSAVLTSVPARTSLRTVASRRRRRQPRKSVFRSESAADADVKSPEENSQESELVTTKSTTRNVGSLPASDVSSSAMLNLLASVILSQNRVALPSADSVQASQEQTAVTPKRDMSARQMELMELLIARTTTKPQDEFDESLLADLLTRRRAAEKTEFAPSNSDHRRVDDSLLNAMEQDAPSKTRSTSRDIGDYPSYDSRSPLEFKSTPAAERRVVSLTARTARMLDNWATPSSISSLSRYSAAMSTDEAPRPASRRRHNDGQLPDVDDVGETPPPPPPPPEPPGDGRLLVNQQTDTLADMNNYNEPSSPEQSTYLENVAKSQHKWQSVMGHRLSSINAALRLPAIGGMEDCINECVMGANLCYAIDHDVITNDCFIYTNDEDACQPLLPISDFHHVKFAPCQLNTI